MAAKMSACPKCKTDKHLATYRYESGMHHVECDECYYLGPAGQSMSAAITAHNESVAKSSPPTP